ncbi:MAG: GAF domain-containing protein [Bacillota bacterium]
MKKFFSHKGDGELFKSAVEAFPLLPWFVYPAVTVIILIIIYKGIKADEINLFGKIVFSRDKKFLEQIRELHQEFEQLNEVANQKQLVIKLMSDTFREITSLMEISRLTGFETKRNLIYDLILPSILGIITRDRGNIHRAAILIPDDEGENLKMLKGCGYSPDGQVGMKLPIDDSFAGYAFKNKQVCWSGDVTKERLWKPHPLGKTYYSLACIPIVVNNIAVGILNIDGEKLSSFNEDDIDYFKYFASMISSTFPLVTLYMEKSRLAEEQRQIHEDRKALDIERGWINEHRKERKVT